MILNFRSSHPEVVLVKAVLKICRNLQENTHAKATLLKSHLSMGTVLYICCIFSEHLLLIKPLGGCFWNSLYKGKKEVDKKKIKDKRNKNTKLTYSQVWSKWYIDFFLKKKFRNHKMAPTSRHTLTGTTNEFNIQLKTVKNSNNEVC